MSKNEEKKGQQELDLMQSDLERLQKILKQSNIPGKEALMEHMTGKNGLLGPLGTMLNKLLEDPVVRQAMENNPPADTKKH